MNEMFPRVKYSMLKESLERKHSGGEGKHHRYVSNGDGARGVWIILPPNTLCVGFVPHSVFMGMNVNMQFLICTSEDDM